MNIFNFCRIINIINFIRKFFYFRNIQNNGFEAMLSIRFSFVLLLLLIAFYIVSFMSFFNFFMLFFLINIKKLVRKLTQMYKTIWEFPDIVCEIFFPIVDNIQVLKNLRKRKKSAGIILPFLFFCYLSIETVFLLYICYGQSRILVNVNFNW